MTIAQPIEINTTKPCNILVNNPGCSVLKRILNYVGVVVIVYVGTYWLLSINGEYIPIPISINSKALEYVWMPYGFYDQRQSALSNTNDKKCIDLHRCLFLVYWPIWYHLDVAYIHKSRDKAPAT
jgi:hypothetical protein